MLETPFVLLSLQVGSKIEGLEFSNPYVRQRPKNSSILEKYLGIGRTVNLTLIYLMQEFFLFSLYAGVLYEQDSPKTHIYSAYLLW